MPARFAPIHAGLWEREPPEASAREQVVLFNIVTVTTVVIGVLALYLALLVLTLVGAFLLVPRQSLADVLGHPVGVAGVVELAWLATSVATVGGALGAGLESDEAVREATSATSPTKSSRAESSGRWSLRAAVNRAALCPMAGRPAPRCWGRPRSLFLRAAQLQLPQLYRPAPCQLVKYTTSPLYITHLSRAERWIAA